MVTEIHPFQCMTSVKATPSSVTGRLLYEYVVLQQVRMQTIWKRQLTQNESGLLFRQSSYVWA